MADEPSHRTCYVTFGVLLLLLVATMVAAALPLGAAAPVVAFGIALVKALLVALVFMHLGRRSGVTRLFAAGGFLWLALLFTFMLADYFARGGEQTTPKAWATAGETPAGAPPPLPERRRHERGDGRSFLEEPGTDPGEH